jgi:hypothetical protein
MFVKAAFFLSLGAVLAVSCATKQLDPEQFGETIAVSAPRLYTIIDHRSAGQDIPQWLQFYLESGERLVETTAGYAGDYVFVTTEKGGELAALEKWGEYFSVELDFSQAVFLRMYNRLIAESEGKPDYYLGNFFEVFLKKIAEHSFRNANREVDYWIKVSLERGFPAGIDESDEIASEGADSEPGEEYRYYILSKINKVSFEEEIMSLFLAALSETNLEKAQAGVVSRLQSTLFAGF